ncbi:MAG: hypothetical protein E7194_04495 [Erysipelotrichaceae bacterium]|nr:hypothetical protein [Erysipelotrichaceae bacterium]
MARNDFIMSSFNLAPGQIHTLDPDLINLTYHIRTTLNNEPAAGRFQWIRILQKTPSQSSVLPK